MSRAARRAGKRYRVPARLISGRRCEGGMTVLDLAVSRETLERYQLPHTPEALATERPREGTDLAAPQQTAGGLIDRLHVGLDALASGIRDALDGPEAGGPAAAADDAAVLRVPVLEEQIVTQIEPVRI